jgi:hypothetical protein
MRQGHARGAAEGAEPAEEREEDGPVYDPHIVIEHDGNTGGHGEHATDENERRAGQELPRHRPVAFAVEQKPGGRGKQHGTHELCEEDGSLHSFPSLRRHDPDQVLRVSLSADRAPLGTPIY